MECPEIFYIGKMVEYRELLLPGIGHLLPPVYLELRVKIAWANKKYRSVENKQALLRGGGKNKILRVPPLVFRGFQNTHRNKKNNIIFTPNKSL
jgi:hypothetical protein